MNEIQLYEKIEPWYEPTDVLREKRIFRSGMSRYDHGFLCGMIKKLNPKRILEIGVAEGGTTSVIMNCLAMMNSSAEVYSIDISETLYYDQSLKTAYEYDAFKSDVQYQGKHVMLFGKTIAGQIEAIDKEFDLIILDTTHSLPGELLDFLATLHFCTSDAVYILHDVNLNYYRAISDEISFIRESDKMIATKVLYSVVTADKILNSINANIGAFRINRETKKYACDVFYALTLPWAYLLSKEQLEEYRNLYSKYYDKALVDIFDLAAENNRKMLEQKNITRLHADDMASEGNQTRNVVKEIKEKTFGAVRK